MFKTTFLTPFVPERCLRVYSSRIKQLFFISDAFDYLANELLLPKVKLH